MLAVPFRKSVAQVFISRAQNGFRGSLHLSWIKQTIHEITNRHDETQMKRKQIQDDLGRSDFEAKHAKLV